MRLLAVENCVAVGKLLTVSENQTAVRGPHAHCPQASRRSTSRPATRAQVLPIIRAVAQDKSWRVRYVVATHFCDLVPSVGEDVTKLEMLPTFVRLLQDGEAEVRTAAGFKVTVFSEMVSPELVLEHILPCVRELCADTSQHVRASVASVIMGLAPVVGKAGTIDHLLPLFLQLLKDDFPEARAPPASYESLSSPSSLLSARSSPLPPPPSPLRRRAPGSHTAVRHCRDRVDVDQATPPSPVRLNLISTLHAANAVIGVEHLAQSLLPAIQRARRGSPGRRRRARAASGVWPL